MHECSKSIARRLRDPNFLTRYFRGDGIDIGGRPDPLALYTELFPLARSIRTWDLEDGDAQTMESISDESFDFVHSSHCLEHLPDPAAALRTWFRILKPGGYLILLVPDEDLYEQGVFPSVFNPSHRWTFTIFKERSWSSRSLNLLQLFTSLGPQVEIQKIELLTASYRFLLPRYDQTLTPIGEAAIEAVLRKRTADELISGGRERPIATTTREMRLHLNQYRKDHETLRADNQLHPPFCDDSDPCR